jgi:hypothetical protein
MAQKWDVETLRLTLFSSQEISIVENDWQSVTGEPEAETRQNLPGGKRYMGKFAGGQLIIGAVGQRLDISLSWLPPETGFTGAMLPVIGSWDTVRETFVGGTLVWLAKIQFPVIRVAFAAVLLSETKSVVESYQVLKALLKSVAVEPDQMRELIYRVNWPEDSNVVKGLRINRITNWSGIQWKAALVQVGSQTITASGVTSEKYGVRLEVDHNTDENNQKPFEQEFLTAIYKELILKSCENAAAGEKP